MREKMQLENAKNMQTKMSGKKSFFAFSRAKAFGVAAGLHFLGVFFAFAFACLSSLAI